MAIEARQSSFVNGVLGVNTFTSAFETPLSVEQVVTLIAPNIADPGRGTVLDSLGFNPDKIGLQQISISSFEEVSVEQTIKISFSGGDKISPEGADQLFCSYSAGGKTVYEKFDSSNGCKVSKSLERGNVVVLQITVSESIALSECVSAPQFIRIV